jgi:hypothetical protein
MARKATFDYSADGLAQDSNLEAMRVKAETGNLLSLNEKIDLSLSFQHRLFLRDNLTSLRGQLKRQLDRLNSRYDQNEKALDLLSGIIEKDKVNRNSK